MNKTLRIVRLGVPFLRANAGTHDPALDTSVMGAAALFSRHARERSEGSIKALPIKAGHLPVVFHAERLTSRALRFVTSAGDNDERIMRALACGCHEYTDAHGQTVSAKDRGGVDASSKIPIASDEWTEHLYDMFGMVSLREIGSVIVQASEAPPEATDPFELPPGLMLPR